MAEKSQPTVSQFRSLPISGKTKEGKRQKRIWNWEAGTQAGGQLTVKVKPLVGAKGSAMLDF